MSDSVIGSVDKACKILKLFSHEHREWGITEMSKALGLGKSTVHRQVTTLEANGFLRQDPVTGRYKLGITLFELGSLVLDRMTLREVGLPLAERLSTSCNESVHLGILDDGEVVSIEKVETSHTLRPAIYIGKKAPLHCTSIGKAILAFLPRDEQERIITKKGLVRYTDRTITNKDRLLGECELIKKLGYSVDDGEHEEGIRCVGAPIFDHSNSVIASISVSAPSVRLPIQRIPEIAEMVKATAREISRGMGYKAQEE